MFFLLQNNPEPMDGNFTIFNQKNKIRGKKQNNKIQELIYSRFLKLKPSLQNYNALREFIAESISVVSSFLNYTVHKSINFEKGLNKSMEHVINNEIISGCVIGSCHSIY